MQEEKLSILVVEDDIPLRKQIVWLLKTNFEVHEASNRKEAEEILIKEKADIIILDLGLPPHTNVPDEGLKLLKDIANNPKYINAKVIILTGHDTEQAIKEAIKEGAFDYIIKPVSPESLKQAIDRAILFLKAEEKLSKDGILKVFFSVPKEKAIKLAREKAVESLLKQILSSTNFNIYRSAKELSIKRENIYYLLKKFGITRDDNI